MIFKAGRKIPRGWPLVAVGIAMTFNIQPSRSNDNTPTPAVGKVAPGVQFWEFKQVNDAFTSGRTVYLDLTMANGSKEFWNPVNGEFKSATEIDVKSLSRTRFIPAYSPESLANGNTIEMSIVSTGARCGYTVGVDFTYSGSDRVPATFYLIEKYKSLKKTFYCGTPLKQKYDVEVGNVAVSLADDRLLIIDYTKNSAIAFLHVPSTIVALDDESFLVPADFLKPGLDAAGDNQGARYRALLAALKSHPATVVHPTRVE